MKYPFLALTLIMFAISCSTQKTQRSIDDKVAQETGVSDVKTLRKTVHEVIDQSETLTGEQKDQLYSLLKEIKKKNKPLRQESYKLRSVLIKELLSPKVDQKEVKLIKQDIKKVEHQLLHNTLEIMDKISKVVAKDPENGTIMDYYMYYDDPSAR